MDLREVRRFLESRRGQLASGLEWLDRTMVPGLSLSQHLSSIGWTLDVVPDQMWPQGKVDPTEASGSGHCVRVKVSHLRRCPGFDLWWDSAGWPCHEWVHALIFSGRFPKSILDSVSSPFGYPLSSDEMFCFGWQMWRNTSTQNEALLGHYSSHYASSILRPPLVELRSVVKTVSHQGFW